MIRSPRRASGAGSLALAIAVAWPVAARAYRPFDSTDAAVAARGDVEVELGPVGWRARGGDDAVVAPSVVLNWGFAERWEAVLEARHVVDVGGGPRGRRERLEDPALSVKGVLREGSLQDKAGVSVATEISALLPGIHGESGAGAEWAVIASRRWPALTVHVDGAGAWTRTHAAAGSAGLVVEGPDTWTVRPVAEAFAARERGAPAEVSGLAGAIWSVSRTLAFDAAFRRARVGGVSASEFRAGLTWAFGVGFPR